jgi:hypothetical protein
MNNLTKDWLDFIFDLGIKSQNKDNNLAKLHTMKMTLKVEKAQHFDLKV